MNPDKTSVGQAPSPKVPHRAHWGTSLYVLCLLTVLHTLSLTDRFLIAAFGTQISVDLGLSNQQFGLVTGLAFTLFYATSGPLAGLLVDRYGPGRLLGIGVLIWSAMTALTGVAKGFFGLWLPRTLVGVGEAILLPAASKILSLRFEPRYNATVFGLFFMGGHIGVGIAYQLGGGQLSGDENFGWRDAFLQLGSLGCVLGALVWLSLRWLGSGPSVNPITTSAVGFGELVRTFFSVCRQNRRLQMALVGLALLHILYAGVQFLQIWLVQDKGFLPQQASALYGRVYMLTAIPATLLGGVAADQFAQRFNTSRAIFVAGVLMLCLPMILVFRLSDPASPLFSMGMVVSIFAFTFPYGAVIALLMDEAPDTVKALVMAAGLFVANVVVIGTGTFLIGLSADVMAAANVETPLTRALLGSDVFLLLAIASYIGLHFVSRSR